LEIAVAGRATLNRRMKLPLIGLLLAGLCGCHSPSPEPAAVASGTKRQLERIVVAPGGSGFVTARGQQPFHPWGMNYWNAGRLM
jgi:hypothetical protein